MADIKKAAVIGAGVMGAGIAAHITNAGIPCVLLDIVPKTGDNRNAIAEGAVAKLLKTDPAPFMSRRNAQMITTGNIDDNLDMLADCDWIVEAVIERLDIKQDLYKKIEKHRKKGSVVSSNTSTIPLKELEAGMPAELVPDFMITHFFNPPRYMRLLEIVAGPKTRRDAVAMVRDFCDVRLGKGVVVAKDTPGFIGNRIGIYWMQNAVIQAIDMGLTVDEADAVGSRPFGIPKTGVFGLLDLIGIDLMPHLAKSMLSLLPKDDPYIAISAEPAIVSTMLKNGWIGRKGPSGFYRLRKDGGNKIKESLDLKTGEYKPSAKADFASMAASKKSGLKGLIEQSDKGAQYAWKVAAGGLVYTAGLVPEIADTIVDVDEAMKDGYGWSLGPFELIDQMGAKWFADKLAADKVAVPPLLKLAADKGGFYKTEGTKLQYLTTKGDYADVVRAPGVLRLADVKRGAKPVIKNPSAKVWDLGDGVLNVEFTSRANSLDPMIMAAYKDVIKLIKADPKKWKGVVIHNEGPNFSVGANIGLLLFAANIAVWSELESQIEDGQKTYQALKMAPFPVVSAPLGMALGGGCEILLHSDAIQAHAETYTGLVEVGVGVIPGWGGCKEMLLRLKNDPKLPKGPIPAVAKAFELIGTAQVAKSAFEAKEMGILRKEDQISMNRDRLLADAKAKVIALAENYTPPKEQVISLPGPHGVAALKTALEGFKLQGKLTPHDEVVSLALAKVLTGGNTDHTETIGEKDLMKLERQAFMDLIKTPATLARIEHMLDTGKPLRN
jgi:3-hydroxyacyl-CoA dehydrogenase